MLTSGTRYIHGKRTHFIDYKIEDLQKGTYEEFEDKYFILFKTLISKNFTGQLRGYGGVSSVYPTTLLNAFTAGFTDR